MKLIKKSILFLVAAASSWGKGICARPLIDVAIDSAAILIGEQTTLHLTVTADKDRPVQIVIPNITLMTGVEVLNSPRRTPRRSRTTGSLSSRMYDYLV